MKKFFFVSIFFLFTGIASVVAQSFPVNPIPSYNVSLTTLNTGFQEIRPRINPLPSREKRDMEVTISSSSTSSMTIFAKVWLVKDNGASTLGPYFVAEGDQLTVPIDNGRWGVVIRCEWNVSASVWID